MRDLQLQLAVELNVIQLNFVGNWVKMEIHVGDVEVTHLHLENCTRHFGTSTTLTNAMRKKSKIQKEKPQRTSFLVVLAPLTCVTRHHTEVV